MKTVVKNAPSDTMKAKNSRKLCSFDFSRKEDLRSYLNYNTKKVLYVNRFFFFLKESIVNPNKHLECL